MSSVVKDKEEVYKKLSFTPRSRAIFIISHSEIWNESIQKLDDSIRSNNGDKDKVLATVAFTALTFTDQYPKAKIFVEGSTVARTRLYQMGINNNLLEISLNFNVKGYQEGYWEPFRQGRNYKAFLIQRK